MDPFSRVLEGARLLCAKKKGNCVRWFVGSLALQGCKALGLAGRPESGGLVEGVFKGRAGTGLVALGDVGVGDVSGERGKERKGGVVGRGKKRAEWMWVGALSCGGGGGGCRGRLGVRGFWEMMTC